MMYALCKLIFISIIVQVDDIGGNDLRLTESCSGLIVEGLAGYRVYALTYLQ